MVTIGGGTDGDMKKLLVTKTLIFFVETTKLLHILHSEGTSVYKGITVAGWQYT